MTVLVQLLAFLSRGMFLQFLWNPRMVLCCVPAFSLLRRADMFELFHVAILLERYLRSGVKS